MAEEKKRGLWWWIDRWRSSDGWMGLTLAEQGAYRNLLDEYRLRGGLPNDDRVLAKACGDPLEWPNVRDKVLAKFVLEDGAWKHRTADEVNGASDAWSAAQSKKGKARAAKADRKKGRFTSPASRTTSRTTSRKASQTTSREPAGPPASVSVSVSVSGSVSGTGENGLAPAVAVADSQTTLSLPKPGAPEWRTEFADDYIAAYGGRPDEVLFGQVKRGAKQWGWGRARPVLRFYMAESPNEYLNLAKFFTALPSWEKRMGGAPSRAGPPSVGEKAMRAAAAFIAGGKGGGGDE